MKNLIRNVTLKRIKSTDEYAIKRVELFCKERKVNYGNLKLTPTEISFTTYSKISYDSLVNQLVKQRYSDSEEFAILRKAINGITDEYLIYNAYVEDCKVKAKEFIAERESALNDTN